jgi:DNA-directed RNA polymerase subunit H (RpoH/RPB5)
MDIECPECQRHSMLKTQVYSMNVPMEMVISEEEFKKIENKEMDIMKEKLSKIENFDEKIQEISRKLES